MVDLNNTDMQFQYIKMMCGDKQSFIKAKKLFIPEFFGTEVQNTAKFVKDYYDKHGDLPSSDIIKASVGIDIGEVSPLKSDQREWLLENFESFIKVSGMRHAVMEASKYTVDNPERIIDIIQGASKLNLERDFGLDYQSDPKQRLENIRLRSGNVSNGYDSIDIVAGKANYGDLFIVAGSSGCVTADTKVRVVKLPNLRKFRGNIGCVNTTDSTAIEYLEQFYTYEELHEYTNGDSAKINDLYGECQPIDIPIGDLKGNVVSTEHSYVVDSPDGWVPVLDCVEKSKDEMYSVEFDHGLVIKASHDHLFQRVDGEWLYTRDIKQGEHIIAKNREGYVTNITRYDDPTLVYDLSVDHHNHRYYTEDICSHNTGKSLLLQNIAINYYQEGKNVIYITLELHPELCARRMDAMNLNIDTSELYNRLDLYSDKIKKQKDTGKLTLKYMPSGTKTSEIKSLIEDYMMETGVKLDAIIVDYLDLVDPNSNNVKAGDTFAKDKYVSEELRNMSQDLGIVCFTASQLNRDAVQQEELHHGHIAGGMSKINTADLVLGIISSNMHREKGIYELQILKNRNGTGTGKKVRLSIDANTMRISDDEEFLADIEIYQQAGKATLSPTEKMMNKVQNALNGDNKEYHTVDEETGEKLIDQTVGAEQSTSDTSTIEIGKPSQTGTFVKAQLPPEVRSQAAASKLAGLDSLLGDDDDDY